MELHTLILTQNDCFKANKIIKPKGIMVHSTGANNPWLNRYVGPDDGLLGPNRYDNHWNRGGSDKCVHAFIGKLADGSIATYQTLPWNIRGWHAGGSANDTHIGFEICEDDLKGADYFARVYREAAELCAYLCRKNGFTEQAVICHSEGAKAGIASNHGDVMHWFPLHGKTMDTFRAEVKELLANGEPEPAPNPIPSPGKTVRYIVGIGLPRTQSAAKRRADELKAQGFDTYIRGGYFVQVGSYSNAANAEKEIARLCDAGISDASLMIFEE